ncbi:squalene/phytoene synthase family protein [Acetobacteraceae bacterium H6797]|nr:squalene/phytoene synthase family protein [Acetobacteraceae bacterium H6797]
MPETQSLPPLAALARRADPDRFLASLFAAPEKREAIWALIGFDHELARAVPATSQMMTALIRLQWWRDMLAEAEVGAAPRQHEVAAPLHAAITAGVLDAADLHPMIDAREIETEEAIPSEEAFFAWARGTAGGWAVAAGRALGAPPEALARLQSIGTVCGVAATLRGAGVAARQGRCLLPEDLLVSAGTTPHEVAHDPRGPAVKGVVQALARRALTMADEARSAIPRPAMAAALPLVLARRDLGWLLSPGYDVAQVPPPRGLGARLAVSWAGMTGRV